jgi:single-stranded DNA-binding protein
MINQITINGRVGRIEKKQTGKGAIVVGTIAHEKNTKDRATGNWVKDTMWFDFVYFGRDREGGQNSADRLAASVEVGDILTMVGQLQKSKWQTSEGEAKEKVQIIIDGENWVVQKKIARTSQSQRPPQQQSFDVPDEWA